MFSYFFIAILGLITGSFLSMLTYRFPRGLGIGGRSCCPKCNKTIPWFCNIPLFAYLALSGKCINCKNNISLRYPLIEGATAIIFILTLYVWQNSQSIMVMELTRVLGVFSFPFYLLLTTIYISLIITDLEHTLLPDQILRFMGLLIGIYIFLLPSPLFFSSLLSAFAVFAFFLGVYLITKKRGMGFGDVKMVPVIASLLGLENSLIWLMLSFVLGGTTGLLLIIAGRARFGKPIPFGPFLLLGAYIAFFFAEDVMKWYVGRL